MTLNQDFGSPAKPNKKKIYVETKDIIIDGEQMTDEKLHEFTEDAVKELYKLKGWEFNRMPYIEDEPTA